MLQRSNNISLHFGTAKEKISDIASRYGLISLIILDQMHGNQGHIIRPFNASMSFKSVQGDFLITQEQHVGLGILAADCLPIVFADTVHSAIGIAHAGWRGSVENIVQAVVNCMEQQYGTDPADVSVFLGPCAKVCCYQVQPEFIQNFAAVVDKSRFFVERNDKLFFDLPLFNKSLLISAGIPQTAINEQYNYCTICDDDHFSFRRQGEAAGRNINVVWIR